MPSQSRPMGLLLGSPWLIGTPQALVNVFSPPPPCPLSLGGGESGGARARGGGGSRGVGLGWDTASHSILNTRGGCSSHVPCRVHRTEMPGLWPPGL